MKKYLLLVLLIFSVIAIAQKNEPFTIQNAYLGEILNTFEEGSFTAFDLDDVEWRKKTIGKITSVSNIQEGSYLKTAMILHMLKYKLGDITFYNAIENYKNELAATNNKANILDFQYYLENESGIELTHFFNDWFKSKGHPSYEISWFQREDTYEVSFSVVQKQSDISVAFFELPVPIKLIGSNNESQLVRLELSEDRQSFNGHIPFNVVRVEVDPYSQLISNNNLAKIGMDQELLNKEISLYPNPVADYIQIQNSSKAVVEKVSIFNMLGKLVLEETDPLSSIDLKQLSLGMHLVKIETTQGTLHKTILKK
ncbi:MAG: T9SS type A sorting domain-containing protein [Flavobacteriaceae bacterium]|nr:T9SS type A sorting domain-containing protein [Flavobacteriaceae bacterium]